MPEGSHEDSLRAWEANADFWDARMGDASNEFHRLLVRPDTEGLLAVRPGERVLDIACGNGNFSQRLAELGARVVAFDFSARMIQLARRRRAAVADRVDFRRCDAARPEELEALGREGSFDKAVANMALMDISRIEPLVRTVHRLLVPGGCWVFSTHHPCFVRPEDRYRSSWTHQGEAIVGQPSPQPYYHRSLQTLLQLAFETGFVMDGFSESVDGPGEYPVIIIVRLRKPQR